MTTDTTPHNHKTELEESVNIMWQAIHKKLSLQLPKAEEENEKKLIDELCERIIKDKDPKRLDECFDIVLKLHKDEIGDILLLLIFGNKNTAVETKFRISHIFTVNKIGELTKKYA